MRHLKGHILLAVCTLLVGICAAQQPSTVATAATVSVPNLIRYSGTLKDAQGAVVPSAATGATFAIYNQQEGGAPIWIETQNVMPDGYGQYSVILGSTSAAGLPDDLFAQQEQRWLGVQVEGQAEQPRVLLVSVPYAFKAHEADTLGGLPSSAFVKVPAADEVSGSTANPSSPSGIASAGAQGKTSVLPPATVPVVAGSPCPSNALNPAVAVLPIFTTLGTSDLLCDSVISQVALGSNSLVNINGSVSMNGGVTANGANVSGPVFATGVVSASQYQINRQTAFSVLNPTSVSVGFSTGNAGSNADTFVGFYAGNKNTGQFNTYVGHIAGEVNSSGWYNTFIGSASGYSSTTGMTNAFLGERAGVNNTSGNQNVFFGQNAGVYSIIGSNNVYLASPGAAGNESNTTRIGFPTRLAAVMGSAHLPAAKKYLHRRHLQCSALAWLPAGHHRFYWPPRQHHLHPRRCYGHVRRARKLSSDQVAHFDQRPVHQHYRTPRDF